MNYIVNSFVRMSLFNISAGVQCFTVVCWYMVFFGYLLMTKDKMQWDRPREISIHSFTHFTTTSILRFARLF